MRLKAGSVLKLADQVADEIVDEVDEAMRTDETPDETADEIVDEEDEVAGEAPCGLTDFEGVGVDATFGDGKAFFLARCRATSDPEVCGAAASLIWEKQDLSAPFMPDGDSVFCTALSSVMRSYGESGLKSPLLPEVSSLLSSLDKTAVSKERRRHRRRVDRLGGTTSCHWGCYLARYPDLDSLRGWAAGHNDKEAREHWERHGSHGEVAKNWNGVREVRKCTCPFDCNFQCYLNRYKDLRDSLGSTNTGEAAKHYLEHGLRENRICTCHDPTPAPVPTPRPTPPKPTPKPIVCGGTFSNGSQIKRFCHDQENCGASGKERCRNGVFPSLEAAKASCQGNERTTCHAVYGGGRHWWTFNAPCKESPHQNFYTVFHCSK